MPNYSKWQKVKENGKIMGIINLLDLQTANLIAAGEVVERAASVVKELCENSIDAAAKNITVEIKHGGNSYIRVSDDGKGISEDDIPKTILRHATSKIKTGSDLEAIGTLGFRGEALAAVSSVARMTIISKQPTAKTGSMLEVNDEYGVVIKETGCPDGTTIIVRDLFYNVPARRKFMKRDATEAMAVAALTEKLAMSHPEIAFRLISDGETKFTTPGDGKLLSAIYGVAGRAFAAGLESVSYELEGMTLRGYISRPDAAKGTRSSQSFFINNRYIRSRTMTAALEEAYKSYIPSGRFPAAVLFLETSLSSVDVNVHPSKLEVRFSNEKNVFDTVYYGVRSVLEGGFKKAEPEEKPRSPLETQPWNFTPEIKAEEAKASTQEYKPLYDFSKLTEKAVLETMPNFAPNVNNSTDEAFKVEITTYNKAETADFDEAKTDEFAPESLVEAPTYRIVGELFATYAVVEVGESVSLIDKHAAHERIIYEKLRKSNKKHTQLLLEPLKLDFSPMEIELLIESKTYLESYGFVIKERDGALFLDGIPALLMQSGGDLHSLIGCFVSEVSKGMQIPIDVRADSALYSVACKAAIKAGKMLDGTQLDWIVQNVLNDTAIRFCPHGRPIIYTADKKSIEKLFNRT
ncbi:MAG: DNA mismatch repair endonuclease MutL [Eubacteriales bacterium]|nr:DNA mismatch repair endonuclease MutL [Eubacteriales bacterium]